MKKRSTIKSILKKYPNFHVDSTGANNEAYRHPLDNGGTIEISDGDGELPAPNAKDVCISMYDADSNPVTYDECCAVKNLEKTIDRYIAMGRIQKHPKKGTRIPAPVEVKRGLLVFDLRKLPGYMNRNIYLGEYMAEYLQMNEMQYWTFHLCEGDMWNVWVISTSDMTGKQAMKIARAALK